jgi:tetratricopeptide (TPR) repeat protein
MKLRTMIYSLLLATLCMGCGGRIGMRQLEQLEARMNDAPDSVLAVLTATDMPRRGERRALYALLTVQAQDKSGLDVADDSLLRVATRYYDRKGLPLRRLQAFYYHGRVYANAGLKHEAMTAYTRAEEFVDEVEAPYSVGLLYAQMGVLYGNDYDYPRALECMEEALHYYELAGKERLQHIAKRDMGLIYLNMLQYPQADSLLNEVLVWGEAHNNSHIINSVLIPLLRLYDATANIEALGSLFIRYPVNTLPKNTATYNIIAHYYALKGDKIASEDALEQAWQMSTTAEDTAKLWNKSYLVGKLLGDEDMALRSHEHLLAHQDSIVRITLQHPLIASQRDHYETRLKVEELRNQQQRYLMRGTAVIVLMVAVVLAIYVRNCFRRKQEELNEYMELADELRHTLYHKEESIANNEAAMERIRQELQLSHTQLEELRVQLHAHDDTMQTQIAELLGGQFQLLNRLSETYYELESSKEDTPIRNRIFEQVKAEIDSLRDGGGKYIELEAIVNRNLDNIMARLRAELPHLKEQDFIYLTFFYARFSGKAISLFTRTKRDTIYKIKERLCKKIKTSDAPSRDFFLSNLS